MRIKGKRAIFALLAAGLVLFLATAAQKGEISKSLLPGSALNKLGTGDGVQGKNISDVLKNPKLQLEKDRYIILVNGTQSAGGGGGGGSRCSDASYRDSVSDYYVKSRVTRIETVFDEETSQNVTITYARVDEYDKTAPSDPDISPGDLLIISPADSSARGEQIPEQPSFLYLYLKQENRIFSLVC